MTTLTKFSAALTMVLILPALAAAARRDPLDRSDAMRLRTEIRREARDAVRRAHRDVRRARAEARREVARARREAHREAHRAMRELRHDRRW